MQSGGREPSWGQRLLQPGERPGQRELGQAIAGRRPGDAVGQQGLPPPWGCGEGCPTGGREPLARATRLRARQAVWVGTPRSGPCGSLWRKQNRNVTFC